MVNLHAEFVAAGSQWKILHEELLLQVCNGKFCAQNSMLQV